VKPLRFSWWALLAVGLLGGGLTLAVCAFNLLPDTESVYIDVLSGRLKVVRRQAGFALGSLSNGGVEYSELVRAQDLNRTSALYYLYHHGWPQQPRWELLETRTRWLGRDTRRRTEWRRMLYLPDGVGMICKGVLEQGQPRRELTGAAARRFIEDWLFLLRSTPDATIPQRFLLATAKRLQAAEGPVTEDDLLDPQEFLRNEQQRD
jgi:hypothetical protein